MTERFFNYLQFEKRVSHHTLSAYRIDISQFQSFLRLSYELENAAEATYPMIRSWIISLTETDIQPVSVNRKIAAIRAFYKFMLQQGAVVIDPSVRIVSLKAPKRLPSFLSEGEAGDMLENIPTDSGFEGARDKLILELLYGTGMRLSELLGLKPGALNLNDRNVRVLGKRNKERVIPFGKSLLPIINKYLAMRAQIVPADADSALFVTGSGESCYPMMIYRLVKRNMAPTQADRKSPHIMRHTYATHLINRGAEINAVKDLLGHSSLAATQVYTHNSIDKIKRTFNQAHPKA